MSTAPAVSPQPAPKPIRYYAEIHPGPSELLPRAFADGIKKLESLLSMPIWLLVQNGTGDWSNLGFKVFRGFREYKAQIAESQPVALLLDSAGGDAQFAYHIARLFQRRTNKFMVIVPQYAKSAATLLGSAVHQTSCWDAMRNWGHWMYKFLTLREKTMTRR